MKLKKIYLKNFRGAESIECNINDLNVFIGKNDVGKSTILEALDIYFNGKPDKDDKNVFSSNEPMVIGCIFETESNKRFTLDSTDNTSTTLEEEYLLNKDGDLEIIKIFEGDKLKEKTCLIAKHPNNFDKPLILLKINELKKIINDNNYDTSDINMTIKKDLRRFLFDQVSIDFEDEARLETSIASSDVQCLFNKFKDDFPTYMLFKSDRTNTDKDSEVTDDLKAITKTAVSEVESEFQLIKNEIDKKIEDIANKTLEKLKTFDPKIAAELTHEIEEKPLDSLFKFNFRCENNISFNKRGSGVKRLMLLSFFLAQSERPNHQGKNIIYAIEEPETSQHPDFQKMLFASLQKISENNLYQVLLTTHTPEIVKILDKNNLIFIKKEDRKMTSHQSNNLSMKEVCDTLGVLPILPNKGVIFVEGKTDITFFKNLNHIFPELKSIIDINKFTFIDLGGCANVERWATCDYLKHSSIKSFFIRDKDERPIEFYADLVNDNNKIVTLKREIENYFPLNVVSDYFDIQQTQDMIDNWDEFNITEHLSQVKSIKKIDIKQMFCSSEIWDTLRDSTDFDLTEIKTWFEKIKEFFSDVT
ncbi:MAG: ATP-binding protein [Alphaproteobacteria bacterium]|jgi:predicted ATP-dependent endonuclease of OLD family|nr:ATP-binding protein [Alphaproteobacteria bacterium]